MAGELNSIANFCAGMVLFGVVAFVVVAGVATIWRLWKGNDHA